MSPRDQRGGLSDGFRPFGDIRDPEFAFPKRPAACPVTA
jgi:hypothetical protein